MWFLPLLFMLTQFVYNYINNLYFIITNKDNFVFSLGNICMARKISSSKPLLRFSLFFLPVFNSYLKGNISLMEGTLASQFYMIVFLVRTSIILPIDVSYLVLNVLLFPVIRLQIIRYADSFDCRYVLLVVYFLNEKKNLGKTTLEAIKLEILKIIIKYKERTQKIRYLFLYFINNCSHMESNMSRDILKETNFCNQKIIPYLFQLFNNYDQNEYYNSKTGDCEPCSECSEFLYTRFVILLDGSHLFLNIVSIFLQ
uniref:Uncharacterized protein n=1 Tax=Heterorhabditis bacteriophora TaxID=37862 RepID=A0A1I7WBZ8_HETBA